MRTTLIITMLIALAACSKSTPTEPLPAPTPTPTAVPTATPTRIPNTPTPGPNTPTPTPARTPTPNTPTPTSTPTPPASLTGIVTTSGTSTPITGAQVTTQGVTSTTGTDGRYTLSGLTTGSTTITASRSGYEPYSQTITLNPGTNQHAISLSQSTSGTTVTGIVRGTYPIDGSTYPLPDASITIAGKTDRTDGAGNFSLPTIPEGNQAVTVALNGWAPYSQTFFISSTNRTLTINLTYNGPDLRGITPVFVPHTGCGRPGDAVPAAFTVELQRFAGTITANEPFIIETTYTPSITINGRPPTSPNDPARYATQSTGGESCGFVFLQCDRLPNYPPARGPLSSTVQKGTYNNLQPALPYLGAIAPINGDTLDAIRHAPRALLSTASDRPLCPTMTSTATSMTFQYQGTITMRYTSNTNRWTTHTINFTTNNYPYPIP